MSGERANPARSPAGGPGEGGVEKEQEKSKTGRRAFLGKALAVATTAGTTLGATKLLATEKPAQRPEGSFPTPDYDWTKHDWGFGVDSTRCIGCLRCVEACKIENGVSKDPHHFRTWVERYVYLEGEDRPRVDSQANPGNIAAAKEAGKYRFDNRYAGKKVKKAFFAPKLCNHCRRPPCVQVCPTGATFKAKDGTVLVDETYCIGCMYCIQACPYGARFLNYEKRVAEKCTWCYHRITKGLNPACVEACPVQARIFGDLNDRESPISKFIAANPVQVLKPEAGTVPTCFYIGIDSEVR